MMIPTLFGVTIISFCIMQLAPGDPLLNQLGTTGLSGKSSQTREAFLLQKRDLKLDKPLILNFNYFRDYLPKIRIAAHYLARSAEEVAAELPALARVPLTPEATARLRFLRSLGIEDFRTRLEDPGQHVRLAGAIQGYVRIWCEDQGIHGVPSAIEILRSDDADLRTRIGTIRCLNHMVIDPFVYTYSRHPTDEETPLVVSTWRTWWERAAAEFPKLDPDQRTALASRFDALVAEPSRARLFSAIEDFDRDEMRFFAEKLLGDSTRREKVVASLGLRLYVGKPLKIDVPRDADAKLVDQVAANWFAYYEPRRAEYQPSLPAKLWYIVGDTQYSHMVWRLVTFNFGRSALKTREPVSEKIFDAVIVSAPLMLMASLMIYMAAVPLGIICAVNRGGWIDRLISLGLFLLYSIPPFVAGMLFLLFFCYGSYLKLFPMLGLHSEGADSFGFWTYMLDYLWHIFLPVTCLSLFSLAGMAMYSRTSMLDVIGQDYIRTARAKGVPESKVILKHGLRNALIPIVTLFSGFLPAMLGGSVLIEYLFGIPGMGRLSWESIEQKDFPTLMALIYINAIVVMLSILLTDLMYVFVDPRISFESQEGSG